MTGPASRRGAGFVRPEIVAALRRWREVLAGGGVALFGLWLLSQGGWLLGPLGAIGIVAGLALAFAGWRRLRFAREVAAPGIVEVVEGRITYFGPETGGAVALTELTEIAVARDGRGHRAWRLRQPDRELTIPQRAEGAERLFDLFTALPGARSAAFLAALDGPDTPPRIVWRRPSDAPRLGRPGR